jgi:serine/threonine protein kinase
MLNQNNYFLFFIISLITITPSTNCFDCFKYIQLFPEYICEKSESIGKGSNGSAFIVSKQNQKFILKVQPTTEKSEKELQVLTRLKGVSGIVQLYEHVVLNNTTLLIIEYGANGTLLNQIMHNKFRNNYEDSVAVIRKLVVAVREMHKRGIVHADLKPDNIVMDEDNNPIIIDFDLAVNLGDSMNGRGSMSYMAPEIVKAYGKGSKLVYDQKIDIYSIGVIFYALIKNQFPIKLKALNYNEMLGKVVSFKESDQNILYEISKKTICLKSERVTDDELYEMLIDYTFSASDSLGQPISYSLAESGRETSLNIKTTNIDVPNTKHSNNLSTDKSQEYQKSNFTNLEIFMVVFLAMLLVSILIGIICFSKSTKKKFVSPSFSISNSDKTEEELHNTKDTNITFSH